MNTTVYLIRHSIRFNEKDIEQYNTTQNKFYVYKNISLFQNKFSSLIFL